MANALPLVGAVAGGGVMSAVWRTRCRWLSVAAIAAIAAVQALIVAPVRPHAVTPLALASIAVCAALYGAGKKLADLTEEHGLAARPYRGVAYALVLLGLLGLAPFTAGMTLLVADVAFHGVIKAKADTRGHFWCAAVVLAAVLVIAAVLPAGRVDVTTVGIVLATSVAWMWINNRKFVLGDNLFHVVRGDRMIVFALLAWLDPARWLPFAVAVLVEPCAYGFTKLIAMRRPWYREGEVSVDGDPLGIAFHRDVTGS